MKVCWITVCCSQCGSQGDSLGESQCDSQTNLVRALVLATNSYNWKMWHTIWLNVAHNVSPNVSPNVSLNVTFRPTLSELWSWQPKNTIGKKQIWKKTDWKKTDLENDRLFFWNSWKKTDLEKNRFGKKQIHHILHTRLHDIWRLLWAEFQTWIRVHCGRWAPKILQRDKILVFKSWSFWQFLTNNV